MTNEQIIDIVKEHPAIVLLLILVAISVVIFLIWMIFKKKEPMKKTVNISNTGKKQKITHIEGNQNNFYKAKK